ncbi:MAG TPA: prephenate dehydrogenase [Bacteroidota bacterium]|nr:prephenate dehydrogenase [Bacteroidota bacterium]
MKNHTAGFHPFRTVAVIGVGLIGGSLALAIKHKFPRTVVIGFDSSPVLRRALRLRAIDRGARSLQEAVRPADLTILATPVSGVLSLLGRVARLKKPGGQVTDVGSVKRAIMARAEKYFPDGSFIGGHPMAGVEQAGIDAASPHLFESALYVLTPSSATPRAAVRRLGSFLAGLGARVVILDAGTHDRVASAVSHLPQLAAVALVQVAGNLHPESRRHLQLAAGGFRDLTRIASSKFEMWEDIFSFNAEEITKTLDLYLGELHRYRSELGRNSRRLRKAFRGAGRIRAGIPKNMKGFLHPLSEVYVFVRDKPGMLARLTGVLGKSKVNIRDLELVKVREGEGGTFRISFDSKEVSSRAARILRQRGFDVTLRA